MGCDIHMYAEVRKENGWHPVKGPCDTCEGDGKNPDEARCDSCGMEWYPGGDDLPHTPEGKCLFGPGQLKEVRGPCYHCNGRKEALADVYEGGRNYELFGILSGVRGRADENFTEEDRGIPDDASDLVKAEAEGVDWHSHGHYYLDELEKRSWAGFPAMETLLEKLSNMADDPANVRIVFWYDN